MSTNYKKVGDKTAFINQDGQDLAVLGHAGAYRAVALPKAEYDRLLASGMSRDQIAAYGRDNFQGLAGNIQSNTQAEKAERAYLTSQKNKGGGLFGGGLGSILKIAAPLALSFLAPGIGTALGSALGAGAAWAPTIGSGLIGAGIGGLTGGGAKGALLGGATGALGGALSGGSNALSRTLGTAEKFGPELPSVIKGGSGLASAAQGATSSGNFLQKAGGALSGALKNVDTHDALKLLNIASAFKDPKDLQPAGTISQQDIQDQAAARAHLEQQNNQKFIAALNAPPMNRARTTAPIDYAHYGQQGGEQLFFDDVNPQTTPVGLAKGGMVHGPGGPKDDKVPAWLSNGEYVMTAKATKAAGKGDPKKGAAKFKKMDKKLSKGGALSAAMGA